MGSLPVRTTTSLSPEMGPCARDSSESRSKCSLLLVDDDPAILLSLSKLVQNEFEVLAAGSAGAAQQIIKQRAVDLILTDQVLHECTGIQLLEWVRENSPQTVRLIMTGLARLEDAVDAINCGQVYRYLFKPWR